MRPLLRRRQVLRLNLWTGFSLHIAMLLKEYHGTEKPKLLLCANYPVDYYKQGPLVRLWCMHFETVLLFLKEIAANSNYKNVVVHMEIEKNTFSKRPVSGFLGIDVHNIE